MQHSTVPVWFIPSFHGDIRLEARTDDTCDLITTKLTPAERDALKTFGIRAIKKKWLDKEVALEGAGESTFLLRAPIKKASTVLAKILKPDRTIISAVQFKDGTMEEIRSPSAPGSGSPSIEAKEPKAAASVAAPTRGCPPPDFCAAELKARAVMRMFLDESQLADFNRYNRFISIGATTGNRYMITSRQNRDDLARYTRTLYDLDLRQPLCVHDWDVPPAEEMLSLHMLVRLPGWENYLRVTEDNMECALFEFMGDRRGEVLDVDDFADEVTGRRIGV